MMIGALPTGRSLIISLRSKIPTRVTIFRFLIGGGDLYNFQSRPLTSILKKDKSLPDTYARQTFLKNHLRLKEAGEAVKRLRVENKEQAQFFEMIKRSQGFMRQHDSS